MGKHFGFCHKFLLSKFYVYIIVLVMSLLSLIEIDKLP